jgi:hypothetical protein
MSNGELGLLLIGVAGFIWLFSKKKKPGMMIVETFEVFEVRRRPWPGWLVNMLFLGGIALFIWIMNR